MLLRKKENLHVLDLNFPSFDKYLLLDFLKKSDESLSIYKRNRLLNVLLFKVQY